MHHPSRTKPLLCRELVGREHELQELDEVLQQAARGNPQFVLLAGEAGLGKTKLCRAFMEISQGQQALVLFGQAISQERLRVPHPGSSGTTVAYFGRPPLGR